MTRSWLIGAMESYRSAVERGQQRMLDAQQEACSVWWSAFAPAYPMSQCDLERRLDDTLLVGANLLQAQADTQRDWMLLTERWLSEVNRDVQARLDAASDDAPSLHPLCHAWQVGSLSGSALSKVSRQVGHFAATSLSSTPLRATCDARRVWKRQKA
ncbi:hypothetical protein HNO92_001709 [Chromobacterium alkanivorans]|uniref:hypothetical protein n=1 Tax=Chromobacterium TaxID=535 RepID=UPI0006540E96|nr:MULTISPECIES: hypothetical protein [Chromobacterium]KMN82145.1 hypothetical protein VK98_09745 [Chromobacterium sp. LK11]MBN3003302.1 hypothetical protein [Chromobacterium alkanivorans]MCS3804115.1 hypothetical protein [Chromobacterium alkanivorans]MCS3818664.1 hypothetical protein [Chromobacterium alkanivorans]MCS3873401.1 hypothetical protein [Chromobacterium alkanivorans]